MSSPAKAAEKQIKPFVAVAFGGSTTFVFEKAAGEAHGIIGVGAAVLGDLVGLDIDVARAPGFFQSGNPDPLVIASSVTTVTGNIVLTLPRRMTEYSLRPYFVAGAGVMRVNIDDKFDALPVSETLGTMDLGGGATGFITNRIGLCWDVRHFRSFSRNRRIQGISVGPERLSFWRASMALVIRY